MIPKYTKQFYIGLCSLDENLKIIENIWKTEISKNDGFVSENLRNLIINSRVITTDLLNYFKLQNIDYTVNEANKFIRDVYDFMSINNSSKKVNNDEVIGYNFSWEKDQLPVNLLDSTIACSYVLNYMTNKLKVTINKYNFVDKMDILFTYIKEYVNFTEEELILNKYRLK